MDISKSDIGERATKKRKKRKKKGGQEGPPPANGSGQPGPLPSISTNLDRFKHNIMASHDL